jgi:hypothetical protein
MKNYDHITIREYYHALNDIKTVFVESERKSGVVEANLVHGYVKFLKQAESELPELLLPFDSREFYSHPGGVTTEYYKAGGIIMHISRNLSKLKVRVDDSTQSPAISTKSFHFISDADLRKIIERDYHEIQKGMISESWKSVIIISGGSIEAILLDLLSKNLTISMASAKAPARSDINRWTLNELIDVALEEKLINPGIATLSHSVREYRNLIHPGVEVSKGLKVEPEEGKIALIVLDMLIRELS